MVSAISKHIYGKGELGLYETFIVWINRLSWLLHGPSDYRVFARQLGVLSSSMVSGLILDRVYGDTSM
jgi:hypothetical protein